MNTGKLLYFQKVECSLKKQKEKKNIFFLCGAIFLLFSVLMFFAGYKAVMAQGRGIPWTLHVIDNSSIGADGVRLADANGDGLMDIVTGWEEGGIVMLYINPGPANVKDKWYAVTVGKVSNVEDAVLVDLDEDGAMDVVSSCEGDVKSMFVHWAPANKDEYMNSSFWKTEVIPFSKNVMQWMFCIPIQVDGKNGIDLVAGGKNKNAQIGWFESPRNPRSLSEWKWHSISKAGWIMSLFAVDMDRDWDIDVVVSDRMDEMRGCRWVENPGPGPAQVQEWANHSIGGEGREVMFMTMVDMDKDKLLDVLVAVKPQDLMYLRRKTTNSQSWESFTIKFPDNTGTAKDVNVTDIDMDGKLDIIFSCEESNGKSGVMWMSYRKNIMDNVWDAHEISGSRGTKFDLVELLDLDGDGDMDVITCEEKENLGLFWYENPTK